MPDSPGLIHGTEYLLADRSTIRNTNWKQLPTSPYLSSNSVSTSISISISIYFILLAAMCIGYIHHFLYLLQFVSDLKYKKSVTRHFHQYFYLHLQLTHYRYRVVYRLQVRDMFIYSNKKNYFKKKGGGGRWSLQQNINILEQTVSCIT